ncbi:hypothetical protein ACIXAT_22360 [Bacteroides fragilis]
MAKTCIRVEACNIGSSERHNLRSKELDYIRPELTHRNEQWVECSIAEVHRDITEKYKEATGQGLQKKATTNIEIDKQGNKKEANIYGQWSFGDPSFSTIYFGGEHYWDIDELTKNKFSFYDRSGKFGDPFMNREYIELTPYQENNTTN